MDHTKTATKILLADKPEKLQTSRVTEEGVTTEVKAGTSKVEVAVSKAKVWNDSDSEKDDQKLLDLAFAIDCTGSMGLQISAAKENIRKIVEEIVSSEHADVHMALVEYRDHPPQDSTFITRPHDFTPSIRTMKGWLEGCSAQGGGDAPEAIADALHDLVKLSWRLDSTRVAVLISDAPPHGIGTGGDGFPNGCPLGLDSIEIARQLAAKSVTVYTVGCDVSGKTRDFLMALSHMTGGQFVPLGNATLLSKVIISGAREEISIQALMDEVNQEVDEEMNALAADALADQEEVTKNVYSKLKAKGLQTNRMLPTSISGIAADLTPISPNAMEMSKMMDLDDLRKNYVGTPEDRGSSSRVVPTASFFDSEDLCCGYYDDCMDEPIADYSNTSEDVTMEQASRMVTKSIASRNLVAKMKK